MNKSDVFNCVLALMVLWVGNVWAEEAEVDEYAGPCNPPYKWTGYCHLTPECGFHDYDVYPACFPNKCGDGTVQPALCGPRQSCKLNSCQENQPHTQNCPKCKVVGGICTIEDVPTTGQVTCKYNGP